MTSQKTRLHGPLRVGIGGPVGAGKTSLTEAFAASCKRAIYCGDH